MSSERTDQTKDHMVDDDITIPSDKYFNSAA